MHLSVAGSVVWGFRHCFDIGVHVPALSCCQELMCHGVICWLPSLATYSQCRKKAMIVCECAKVRRLSSSLFLYRVLRNMCQCQIICSGVLQESDAPFFFNCSFMYLLRHRGFGDFVIVVSL